jgi:hypothetical protein
MTVTPKKRSQREYRLPDALLRNLLEAVLTENPMKTSISFPGQRIISYLASCTEPKGLIDITTNTGMSYSGVSIHTRLLVAQHILDHVRSGKAVAFRLSDAAAMEADHA